MTEKVIITKGIGGFYYVRAASGIVECRASGKFRHEGVTPLTGDLVELEYTADGRGYIKKLLPRRNFFVRPPVANLDILVIVVSAAPPVTDLFLVDTMTAVAEHKDIEPVVVINKCDLDPGNGFHEIYRLSGIRCIRTSAVTGEGKDELLEILKGRVSAFSGNSGVGKSSLLNRIDPRLGLRTGELNEKLGRGRHTTRHVELFELINGAIVADTPGFSSFDTMEMELVDKRGIQYCFREFRPFLPGCRFRDCSHVRDSGCAVRSAVDEGKIARSRYESYVRMWRAAREYREWEHKKGE